MISEARKQWVFHMGSSLAKLEATKRGTDGQSLPPAVKPWTISQKNMLPSLICWLLFPSIMKHCRDFTRHPIWPNLWNRVFPSCLTAVQMRSNELSKISVFQHLPDFLPAKSTKISPWVANTLHPPPFPIFPIPRHILNSSVASFPAKVRIASSPPGCSLRKLVTCNTCPSTWGAGCPLESLERCLNAPQNLRHFRAGFFGRLWDEKS